MRRLALALLLLPPALAAAQGTRADYDRAAELAADRGTVPRGTVSPNWLPDGRRFWYRNDLPHGVKEYVLVDAVAGTRRLVEKADLPPEEPTPPPIGRRSPRAGQSPDGKLTAFVRKSNV